MWSDATGSFLRDPADIETSSFLHHLLLPSVFPFFLGMVYFSFRMDIMPPVRVYLVCTNMVVLFVVLL